MKKKVVALVLAAAMTLSLAACGNQTTSTSTSTSTSTETSTSVEASVEPVAPAEPGKVSFMTFDFTGNGLTGPNAEKVLDYVKEYTFTDLDLQLVMSDAYADKLTLTLASGDDMPMIIAVGSMDANIINYAKAGAFWDLTPFLEDKEAYPNLSQAIPAVNENVTIGGQLIGVYRARTIGRNGLGYRQDWAEKLSLDAPETIDDVYEMMHAFTYDDPDGNGKNDTYAMELCSYTGPLDIMQTWFGVGNGWVEQDGKLIPVHQQAEYKEALDWFKKCYDEGLFASDWATRETGSWNNDCKNGVAGMFCDVVDGSRRIWDYYIKENVMSVVDSTQPAAFALNGSIGKTADTKHNLATSGYNGFFVITKNGAKTEEDVKNCLHFLDKMCDDEMLMVSGYGLEGTHWEKDANGGYVDLRTDTDIAVTDYGALNQTVAYIPNAGPTEDFIKLEVTERVAKQNEVYDSNVAYAVTNPALSLLLMSETYTNNGANLDQIIKDARTNYIMGVISEDELLAQWDLWLTSGGQQVIDEVNAAR